MNPQRPKVSWSPGDKLLMIVLGLVLPLGLGLFFWSRTLNQDPVISIPTPTMPATNARDFYIAAANSVMDDKKIGFAVGLWNPATKPSGDDHFYSLAAKQALVKENAAAIRTLHSGFPYPYQEPPVRSFTALFPHYQKIRGLARLLSLQAQVNAEEGNFDGAMGSSLDAIQLGETMPRGGPLIGMLVGDACQAIGRRPAWKSAGRIDAASARTAVRRLETIRTAHVPFASIMQEEKWGTQASLLEMMRKPDWPGGMTATLVGSNPNTSNNTTAWAENVASSTYIRLVGKRKILENNARWMDQSIANARRPYAAHLPRPPLPNDLVNQILLPVFTSVRLNEVKADTENALLLVTLALHAYRLDHGSYPPTLASLIPRYLKTNPTDPFALSGPLRYKSSGKTYLLYSAGPDGKDDGGKAIFDHTKSAPTIPGASDARRYIQQDSQGDIVAGVNVS